MYFIGIPLFAVKYPEAIYSITALRGRASLARRLLALNVIHGLQKCDRYRINSGQTAPSGLTGSAAFDPSRNS